MTEPTDAPRAPMPTKTLIREGGHNGRQLLRIDGVLPLPVGARLELTDHPALDGAHADAIVQAVRVIAANSDGHNASPLLVLEVLLVGPGEGHDLP